MKDKTTTIKQEDLIRIPPKHPRQKFCVTLPLAISINHLYRTKGKKRFMTKQGQEYMQKTMSIITEAVSNQRYKIEDEGVWLVAELKYYFPDKRRRDCHNMHKLVMDSLEHIAFKDDRWVLVRDMFVGLDTDNPRIEVTIYPLSYKQALKEVDDIEIEQKGKRKKRTKKQKN